VKPELSITEYKELTKSTAKAKVIRRQMIELTKIHQGLTRFKTAGKMYINTSVLLAAFPILAPKMQLHSREYLELNQRVLRLEDEVL